MINWDKIKKNNKYIVPILSFICLFIIICYIIIIYRHIKANNYVKQILSIVEKNQETVFSIDKIYLCSSANAIDNSENLKKLNIYQYTDIAIYIKNYEEKFGLTNKNTIKELKIDNIDLSFLNDGKGTQNLTYTNLLNFGNRDNTLDFSEKDSIDFKIVYNNEENNTADYNNPTFYTDCSNPITLKYINNLGTQYTLENDSSIVFDGSILNKANISVEDINCKIKFRINIINNENEKFSCWINFKVPLNDIYEGTSIKSTSLNSEKYNFFNM